MSMRSSANLPAEKQDNNEWRRLKQEVLAAQAELRTAIAKVRKATDEYMQSIFPSDTGIPSGKGIDGDALIVAGPKGECL